MTLTSGRERADGVYHTDVTGPDNRPAWIHCPHGLHHRIQHRQVPEIKDLDPIGPLGI